jgi:hypothetical protein
MGFLIFVVLCAVAYLAFEWVRAHPKPADEPLETYVEEIASEVEQEVVTEAETLAKEAEAEVSKITNKNK